MRFLLGDLPPSEQEEIEDRSLVDEAFFQDLLAAGDSLIHAYLAGALSAADARRFDAHFLATPLRRKRFELVRGLTRVVRAQAGAGAAAATPRWRAAWLPSAAVLIVTLGMFGLWRRMSLDFDERTLPGVPTQAPPARPSSTAPEAPVPVSEVQLPASPSGAIDIAVAETAPTLRVAVPVSEDGSPTYNATLRRADGTTVWRADELAPTDPGPVVVLEVPTRLLTADAYALHVEGERLRGTPRPARGPIRYTLRITRAR